MLKKWHLISEENVFKTRIFSVLKRTSKSPINNENKDFYALSSKDWVVVIAVTKNNEIILVKQFRHGSQDFSLELPGGIIENKQSPLEAAKRELREETGYCSDNWEKLTTPLRSNPAIIDNYVYAYIAYNAEKKYTTDFDEDEDISLSLINKEQLEETITSGKIDHAIMVALIALFIFKDNYK